MDPIQKGELTYNVRVVSALTFTILYYDFLLTFPAEVHLFWKRKHSWPSCVFLMNRYLLILSHVPIIVEFFANPSASALHDQSCHSLQVYHGILLVVAQGGSALLMIMRTYALYNCNRKVAILLVTILGIGAGISTWAINSTVSMDENGAQSAYTVSLSTTDTCILLTSASEGKRYALAWGVILIFDVTVFALTVARTIENAIAWQYGLFYLILRDGLVYFFILIVCYLTNVLTFVFAEPGYRGYLATLTNVLSSTLINRMMLNVRNHTRPSLPLSHMSEDYELRDVTDRPLYRSI